MPPASASSHVRDGLKGLQRQQGKLGWIAMWLLGIPLPLLLILYLIFG